MKKSSIITTSILALAAVTIAPLAMAEPKTETVRFECPHATGGVSSERLVVSGSTITGLGEENFGTYKTKPVFSSAIKSGVPSSLVNYDNNGAFYDPQTGIVECKYKSSASGENSFDVSYQMVNGQAGTILKASETKITIKLPQGIAK